MATAVVEDSATRSGEVGRVVRGQGAQHAAIGLHAFGNLERELRVDRRCRGGEEEVVPVVLHPSLPAQTEEIGESLGDDERERAALLFEDHVGGERRAVDDPRHVARCHARAAQYMPDALDDSDARVVGRGRHLVDVEVAVGVGEHDVGERAADVDADEPARARSLVAHSSDSANW